MQTNLSIFNRKVRGILVRNKIVDLTQLDQILEESRLTKKSLAALVVEKNLVDEKKMLAMLAKEMSVVPVDLEKIKPNKELFKTVSKENAETYRIFPISIIGKVLTLAMGDPSDVVQLDNLKILTGCEIRPVLASEKALNSVIAKGYTEPDREAVDNFMESLETENDANIEVKQQEIDELDADSLTENSSPVIKVVNIIVFDAVKSKASDIHIEPFEKYIRIRYRQDGALHEIRRLPKGMLSAISSRIKIMCGAPMDIAERRRPQDGKFRIKMEGRQIDFRVSILPTVHGEKTVMRILDNSSLALSLDSLGFEEKCLKDFTAAINAAYGMVLVTGPTGSGKSTTLYSALREVLCEEDNIVTVEDPVEYQMEGVNQVPASQMRLDKDESGKKESPFALALRSILRQDPDIVMIGEIRDLETIGIAIKAALTGHLVFSTLHTNDSPSTITRIVDMGIDPFMVAASVLLASAQRLGRKLCGACKQPTTYPIEQLLEVGCTEEEIAKATFFKPAGCPKCNLGYKGRFAILETLPVTEAVQRCIISKGSALDMKKVSLTEGMVTLRRCGLLNAMRGRTSLEQVLELTLKD